MNRKNVVISIIGTVLDSVSGEDRWSKWRPTVAICQNPEMKVDKLYLLCEERYRRLSGLLAEDIKVVSPGTRVIERVLPYHDPWDFEQVYAALYDFVAGLKIDTDKEEYFAHLTTGTHVMQICLFLLVESRHLPGKLLQSAPPQSEAEPPRVRVIDLDLSRYDRLAARFEKKFQDHLSHLKSGISTRNPAFNRTIEEIERVVVRTRAPVLLLGPTGSGKSMLARRIFELKKRQGLVTGSFVEVNCSTIRGDGAMSALFGHKRGAFTGAQQDREGLLKRADGGVLFLDEVAELGAAEQAMLLRAVEEKRFLPLGADREESSDFQLIAASNRDLSLSVQRGTFREDLLARINLWTYRLPPLKERPEDIEPNLEFELWRQEKAAGIRVAFSREARKRYLDFATSPQAHWTANFRDLSASLTRLCTLAEGGRITVEQVEKEIEYLKGHWSRLVRAADRQELSALLPEERYEEIDLFDRLQLAQVVRVCRQCRSLSEAGRMLFAASRARRKSKNDADRLRKYLARFGLSWEKISTTDCSPARPGQHFGADLGHRR